MAPKAEIETGEWLAAGGGNARSGLAAVKVDLDPVPIRQLSALGGLQASVVFARAERVVVADLAGRVQLYAADGRRLWRRNLSAAISATPVVDPDGTRIFTGNQAGWVHAQDMESGTIVWRRELPTKSDPRILSDLLYLPQSKSVVLNSWGGRFHALAAATGEPQGEWDAGLFPYAGAAGDRQGRFYGLRSVAGAGLQFFRAEPGGREEILHQQPGKDSPANRLLVSAAPVLDEAHGQAYFIMNEGHQGTLHAWSLAEGKILWSRLFKPALAATPALRPGGGVVVAGLDGSVQVLGADGAARHRYESGAEYLLAGGVCSQAGTFFIGDPLGRLHAVGSDGQGQVIFETSRAIQARPSFDRRGNLYLAAMDRQVYVFRNRS